MIIIIIWLENVSLNKYTDLNQMQDDEENLSFCTYLDPIIVHSVIQNSIRLGRFY